MSLKLSKRGRNWYYRGSVAGRKLRGSTKTADKEIAQQIIADLEAQIWKCHIHGPEAILTFAQAAILYRQAGREGRYLNQVEDYWRDVPVKTITAGSIRQAAIQLYPLACGATRNRSVIVPAQAIINYSAEMELCKHIKVKRFHVDHKEKTPITWEWIEAFMANANPHLGALACFLFLTGARISEALSVTWSDIDFNRCQALIRQTKVGSERMAHLPGPLMAAIANIKGDRQNKVFKYSTRSTAKVQWNVVIGRADIEKLSFHCCRHGFATAMLQAGIDPVTVAKRGGWKSPQHVFQTYGHALEDLTVTDRIAGPKSAHQPRNPLTSKG